jgi:cysteine desulfurase / selenocysteine lyase
MTPSEARKDVREQPKERAAPPWSEVWISERVLDPAVLARMANEFFTALPELAPAKDLSPAASVSSIAPPMAAAPRSFASPDAARGGLQDASFPDEDQLRALPSALKGPTDPEIAFDAAANPTPWLPAIPSQLSGAGIQALPPSFSFLTDARPIFGSTSTLDAQYLDLLHGVKGLEERAEKPPTNVPPISSFSESFAVPQNFGVPARPEAAERASGFAFLNEARQLSPGEVSRALELSDLQPNVIPESNLSSRSFEVGEIRRDFPILQERVNGRPLIWFDNAATTQKPQAVIDRLNHFYSHENSNIHRAAHELAARATDAYEAAREKVRRFLNASSSREIVFVRGATEGINLIAQSWGRQNVGKDDEIVITWLEHHANIVPWQMLCAEKGAHLRVAPVDGSGQVLLDEYTKLVGPRTRLVSFAHVSNALGTVTPAQEMIETAHRHGAKVVLDGAQAVSHMPVDVQSLDCDFYVFSGHKVFAPTGIGAVYGKSDILERTQPWQGGGSMILDVTFEKTVYNVPPTRFEAGTGSIGDAIGLGAAIDYVQRLGMANIARYEHDLLVYATDSLLRIPGLRLIGTAKEKASVLSFVVDGFRTEDIGAALNREGIAVRAGHHCAQPVHRRFGLESTVRASLALYNTCDEVDALVAALWNLKQGHRSGV